MSAAVAKTVSTTLAQIKQLQWL